MLLREKIRLIFDHITESLYRSEQPSLVVPDDSATKDNFDPISFTLQQTDFQTKHISLTQNPYHFHKLLVVLSQLDLQAANQQKLNKRAVYYTLLKHIHSTGELDDLLTDACYMLGATREQLGVTASAKGLISGEITAELDVDYLQIPAVYTRDLGDKFSGVTKVLVVEKDTLFQRILPLIRDPELLLVTAKGYPDYATRQFLLLLQA